MIHNIIFAIFADWLNNLQSTTDWIRSENKPQEVCNKIKHDTIRNKHVRRCAAFTTPLQNVWCCVFVCALTSSTSWTRAGGRSGTHCSRWWWFPGSTWSEHRGPAQRNTASPGTKVLEHVCVCVCPTSWCPSDTKWLAGLFSGNSQMTEQQSCPLLKSLDPINPWDYIFHLCAKVQLNVLLLYVQYYCMNSNRVGPK